MPCGYQHLAGSLGRPWLGQLSLTAGVQAVGYVVSAWWLVAGETWGNSQYYDMQYRL